MVLLRTRPPLAAYRGMRNELDQLFNNMWEHAWPTARTFPPLNVWETEDALFAETEVPGLKMADLEVAVAGNELAITGRRNRESEENVRYLRRERSFGEFTRTLTLPVNVNADKIEATLKDGVLTIKLPKAAEAQRRKIAVKGL